jgi:hypothetical protein
MPESRRLLQLAMRTRARSPSGTSDGSLIDPFSPREAHQHDARAGIGQPRQRAAARQR